MRSPKEMGIIEIDITNACVHSCSNCTRFCGHHKKTFFMGFDAFKQAVDSLEEWEGIVGIIGGEPTLHPEFERFCDYLREKRVKNKVEVSRGPIFDMQFHIMTSLDIEDSNVVLLSSLSPSYYKHFETINDTFARQLLNDHSNACEHQALLMSRKELGISDEEWIQKRDACWIQNTWSATITPKGAFFCEVAGALDMLFDGPGGWPVKKGWYKRQPDDFKDQLHWCEMCSACLDVPKRLSSEDRDDVTPGMFEKLKAIGSPKALKNRCVVRNPKDYERYKESTYNTGLEYIEAANFQRINDSNRSLHDERFVCVQRQQLENWLETNNRMGWIVLSSKEEEQRIKELLERYIWNPGCFYILDDGVCMFHASGRSIRDAIKWPKALREDISSYYPSDKIIRFSETHPLQCLLGGIAISKGAIPALNENSKIIVYGAGEIGQRVIVYLKKQGINDYYIAVTSLDDPRSVVKDEKIYEIAELRKYSNNSIVILAVNSTIRTMMKNNLHRLGFSEIWEID